jgi:hypothetical protein
MRCFEDLGTNYFVVFIVYKVKELGLLDAEAVDKGRFVYPNVSCYENVNLQH